jgi:hypothetical protein
MQRGIIKPDEAETKAEHYMLYKGMSQKAMAAAAQVSSSKLSRRLNHEEETEDPVHEVIKELHGSVESDQPSIGKGVFQMIRRHAVQLGLAETEPVDVLKMAIERLTAIKLRDIEMMTAEERNLLVIYAAELEDLAGVVRSDAIRVRNQQAAESFNRAKETPA